MKLNIHEPISAIGNANQTRFTSPVNDNKNADGNKMTSCLVIETNIDLKDFPKAWKREPITIQTPAKIKQMLIILRAGTPILNISADALKQRRSCVGKNWNTQSPINIIPTA